ncbi:hypothetical protein chiPu_0019418 [Chiloscyllium punctatum]|uniref:Uncharacterized protein n=1 Tax=Chiloscyllium punctatum TaxID=137246 RepID=A0A401RRT1_CHIPU|nr:hypothetical protein [Chiloscyllium punctatum]
MTATGLRDTTAPAPACPATVKELHSGDAVLLPSSKSTGRKLYRRKDPAATSSKMSRCVLHHSYSARCFVTQLDEFRALQKKTTLLHQNGEKM